MFMFDLPWLQVIVATVAAMIVGALWYGPIFGKVWMKLVGLTEKKIKEKSGDMPLLYGSAIVGSLLQAFVIYNLIDLTGAYDFVDALEVGLWVWFAFTLMHDIVTGAFGQRPLKLAFVDAGKDLVVVLIMVTIFVYWV